jgi:hypothetical protein
MLHCKFILKNFCLIYKAHVICNLHRYTMTKSTVIIFITFFAILFKLEKKVSLHKYCIKLNFKLI